MHVGCVPRNLAAAAWWSSISAAALTPTKCGCGCRVKPTSSFEVTLLEDSVHLEAVSMVAQCQTCTVLTRLMWTGLVQWVDMHLSLPNLKAMQLYGQQLCDAEVPIEMLKDHVLLRGHPKAGQVRARIGNLVKS